MSLVRVIRKTKLTLRRWNLNSADSPSACEFLGLAPNSADEDEVLKSAIQQAGSESGLDPRFILAAVYQESVGCVRIKTTYSPNLGIRNPGLLQGPNGDHTCNDPAAGVEILDPCPGEEIIGEYAIGNRKYERYLSIDTPFLRDDH